MFYVRKVENFAYAYVQTNRSLLGTSFLMEKIKMSIVRCNKRNLVFNLKTRVVLPTHTIRNCVEVTMMIKYQHSVGNFILFFFYKNLFPFARNIHLKILTKFWGNLLPSRTKENLKYLLV